MKNLRVMLVLGLLVLLIVSSTNAASKPIFSATDPARDDYGPGTYTYPTDKVFSNGILDLTGVEIYDEGDTYNFKIKFREPVTNPWNGTMGFSFQMIEIYLDSDGKAGSGFSEFLAGVGAAPAPNNAWEKAIVLEGWPGGFKDKMEKFHAQYRKDTVIAGSELLPIDAVAGVEEPNTIFVKVAKEKVGLIDSRWAIQVLVLSQNGMGDGKNNLDVRVVQEKSGQYDFGGGPGPNIIDLLDIPGQDQKAVLASNALPQIPFYPIGK